jgi:flagellin
MGLRINTNTQSIAAQRNLGINLASQQNSVEKLASGSRIVRAADDAAGLAISEKMKARRPQRERRNLDDSNC